MQPTLNYIVERIVAQNKLHGKKLISNQQKCDTEYFVRADDFLKKYSKLLESQGKTIDYAVDCYMKMIADINYETVQFIRTGEYTSKTFDEVNQRVYNNPDVMEYYVHGILMSQFLWAHHYNILLFFNSVIEEYRGSISNYLEVGGGHGLYASEAIEKIEPEATYTVVDISQSSINLARKMIDNDKVSYVLSDIFDYNPTVKYDFITMGEVLEHVEQPIRLLEKLHSLLNDDGKLFLTVPTNGPTIDHIYLFRNAEEIREVIASAGFTIKKEFTIYSEDVAADIAEKYKVSMMYAGVLRKG